ncbi:MAG: DUF1638 domain-containing protein [Opitutales bacterium]
MAETTHPPIREDGTDAPLAVVACDVFEAEVRYFLQGQTIPAVVELCLLEMGLHDRPEQLRARLQATIDVIEAQTSAQAIVLAYGLCGNGLSGLSAHRCRLVLPRAHDCITLLLGSRERYETLRQAHPDLYWYSPGWNRGGRVPCHEKFERLREAYAEKFDDTEDIEFLIETERAALAHVRKAAHVEFPDLGDASDPQWGPRYTRRCADSMGWDFMHLKGEPQLLQDLLAGRWDRQRFLIVEPGQSIVPVAHEQIVEARPGKRST